MWTRGFEDHAAAGRRLAVEIGSRYGIPSAVAAVSPGGGLLAAPVARAFARPLLFSYSAPLRLSWAEGLVGEFGAVDEDGQAVMDYAALAGYRISDAELEGARRRACEEIHQFYAAGEFVRLAGVLPLPRVLLLDDGLSPGWRMEASIAFVRRHHAARILVATTRASTGAARWFRSDVEGFIALAVGDDHS